MRRIGFTMIELIFVIVIMGILSKFGIEFLSQAYKSFIFSSINNQLQAQSSTAVESIASRLQYRIKDSVIARESDGTFSGLSGYSADTATVLEWVGSDIEGFRGTSDPLWSGIIDLEASTPPNILKSPETNTSAISAQIAVLSAGSPGSSTINDAALYFIGSDSDIQTGYGWGGAITEHNSSVMHPINSNGTPDEFITGIGGVNFSDTDVFEYYQLAWTAYAVGITDYDTTSNTGTLMLYYDYQPWNGESYDDNTTTKSKILMENVSTFQFMAIGSVVKIQVCVNSEVVEDYSLCKEKTIF